MQTDMNLEFFSHAVSADFDILTALLTKNSQGEDKQNGLAKERDFQCYYPDHHQYWALLAAECLTQTGFGSYEDLLKSVCGTFFSAGENLEENEHNLLWKVMEIAAKTFTEEDFIRFSLELRIQPQTYDFDGIRRALTAKYAEKEILPMYKIAMCVNALVLGYFKENPCVASAPYQSSLLELRSTQYFASFKLFEQEETKILSGQERFALAIVLAVIALRKKDQNFYGRSGDSKAELVRKLKRFTVLLKTVPAFAYQAGRTDILSLVYAFNVVYLGMYKMPLPKEMACEMLFGKMYASLTEEEKNAVLAAEKTQQSLEEITKQLLGLGISKDQMQDLIGVLALSNNKLIKIENIFIEWAVKLGLR